MYGWMYVYMYACTCMCMCMCVCVCSSYDCSFFFLGYFFLIKFSHLGREWGVFTAISAPPARTAVLYHFTIFPWSLAFVVSYPVSHPPFFFFNFSPSLTLFLSFSLSLLLSRSALPLPSYAHVDLAHFSLSLSLTFSLSLSLSTSLVLFLFQAPSLSLKPSVSFRVTSLRFVSFRFVPPLQNHFLLPAALVQFTSTYTHFLFHRPSLASAPIRPRLVSLRPGSV